MQQKIDKTKEVTTIIGHLRDKMKDETKREFVKFYKYLRKNCGFDVDNWTVSILGL